MGLIKAAVFGFLIALMGCHYGYHSGTVRRGWSGHDQRCCLVIDPDPDLQLSSNSAFLRLTAWELFDHSKKTKTGSNMEVPKIKNGRYEII